jgi:2-C-methyl-D-erythritol 2,4-cyclodiphosphate synthase
MLGAANLGDIGRHFPDNSSEFHGIDSKIILARTLDLIKEEGYRLGNIDTTIVAQQPKMAPYIPHMQQVLAEVLEVEENAISIKASTTERLGFEGRKEGISAYAVVLLEK